RKSLLISRRYLSQGGPDLSGSAFGLTRPARLLLNGVEVGYQVDNQRVSGSCRIPGEVEPFNHRRVRPRKPSLDDSRVEIDDPVLRDTRFHVVIAFRDAVCPYARW